MNHKTNYEERARCWREIIVRAHEHPVSCHAFCVEEGISQASFYSWRHKLSKGTDQVDFKTPLRLPSVFAEVRVAERLSSISQGLSIDSKWLADFVLHLHGGVR